MKKYLLAVLFVVVTNSVFGQDTIMWASEVMYVTSETTPLQYAAIQALHKPNVYPQSGENPNAWRPRKSDSDEFIVVTFEEAIGAQQIAIVESENPGAISKIYAYDALDNEFLLFDLTPREIPLKTRLLNLFFEETAYKIAYIRIDIAGGAVEGFNSIDAIGISASNIPISVLIDLVPGINTDIQIEALNKNVNSTYVEHSPLLSPDGNTIYFSRKFHPDNVGGIEDGEDIWYSEKDPKTGEWLPAKNIGPPLNTPGPNFISTITQEPDGTTVLLLGNKYQNKGRMTQGASMSRSKGNGSWEKPVNLEIENDYNYSGKADYYLNASNDVILLSAERDDTHGDRDIYVCFKKDEVNWTEPLNLGTTINTAHIEDSPFLYSDDSTMYFSSSGFSGYGGADIYMTKRLDATWTNWSIPENLGKGINSETDDVYFNIPTSGDLVYFTKGSVDENIDVYQFRLDDMYIKDEPEPEPILVNISGQVFNTKNNLPVPNALVILQNIGNGTQIAEVTATQDSAKYNFTVDPGDRYKLFAKENGYITVPESLDLSSITESVNIVKDLQLNPLERDSVISINGIYFEFDKAIITDKSYVDLNRVIKILNSHMSMSIEISAHTDSKGKNSYNLDLSKRRAKAVYDYFISEGIAVSRMISKGYGETKPIDTNKTDQGRAKNRRVDFKILKY